MKKTKTNNTVVVYQSKSGAIELKGDTKRETLRANRSQMAVMFGVNPAGSI